MKNSTGSVGRPNYPEVLTRDFKRDMNSFSFPIPSPVTLETEKIGHTTLSGMAFASTDTSSSSFPSTTIGFLPAYGDYKIF